MITREKNAQIIIFLLKAHGIKHVIVSPGTTNTALVGSIQDDNFFNLYSCVDERSAAYMACGLSAQLNQPVVISCTGATAARNYPSGLTEAFYRKLPILAITSTQNINNVGHLVAQVTDRGVIQRDIAKISVSLPIVNNDDDIWECEIKVNKAILELKRNGGGPAHINLPTTYTHPYDVKNLPTYRVIDRFTVYDQLPTLNGKVAVIIGSHKNFKNSELQALEHFAINYKAPIFCDHTSSYQGKNRLLFKIVSAQEMFELDELRPDIFIHIGEISAEYLRLTMRGKHIVWRVSEDGEVRDTFRRLRFVFEMKEEFFFNKYSSENCNLSFDYHALCKKFVNELSKKIPNVPLSNIWVASKMSFKIPNYAVVHFAILNSLRSWNFFELPSNVKTYSNVGGYGIDGCMSSFIGSSLSDKNKLHFCVIGDLAFFYDINCLGNKHLGKNLRILLINNGQGIEFNLYNADAYAAIADKTNKYVAAEGHFGKMSKNLVKNFAKDLNFDYISASSKKEVLKNIDYFCSQKPHSKSIIFEIFIKPEDESNALKKFNNIKSNFKGIAIDSLKKILSPDLRKRIRKLIKY